MTYGYARVSTSAQDLATQLAALDAAGSGKTYREKASGANAERPKLRRVIRKLEPDDVLMVAAIDRLARDTRDLLDILREVRSAGAGFRSLAEPLVDTTSELAEVVMAVLGIAATWDRGRIIERTAVGRAQAHAGRPIWPEADAYSNSGSRDPSPPHRRTTAADAARYRPVVQCEPGDDIAPDREESR